MLFANMGAQNKLRLTWQRFGKPRAFELYEGDQFSYKLKDAKGLRQDRVTAFGDSLIIFEGRDPIRIDGLKFIRIKKNNYHNNKVLQRLFLNAAVIFPVLQLINNGINGNTPLLNETAAIVSGTALTAYFITRRCDIRKIRMRRSVVFKVLPVDYNPGSGVQDK